MDTSETYIKQCDKAEEIQVISEASNFESHGNYYAHSVAKTHWFRCDDCELLPTSKDYPYIIWLPRQDQLQEMVLPDPNAKDAWGDPFEPDLKTDCVFWLFRDFSESLQERKYSQQTGEQLWLRYVMKKKFNKTWDDEEWV